MIVAFCLSKNNGCFLLFHGFLRCFLPSSALKPRPVDPSPPLFFSDIFKEQDRRPRLHGELNARPVLPGERKKKGKTKGEKRAWAELNSASLRRLEGGGLRERRKNREKKRRTTKNAPAARPPSRLLAGTEKRGNPSQKKTLGRPPSHRPSRRLGRPTRRPSRPSRRTRPTPDKREKKKKKRRGQTGPWAAPTDPSSRPDRRRQRTKKTARKKLRTSSATPPAPLMAGCRARRC